MPNQFDQIVEKEKQKALAKQDADVVRFAQKVADEVAGKIGDTELKESVAVLATTIAEAVVLSNETIDTNLKDNFSRLLSAVQENKPDGTQQELSEKIGRTLANLEKTLGSLQLSPEINLTSLSQEELRTELNLLLEKLPKDSSNEVVIAYENASADQYVNVRLTDGYKFYTAGGGAVIMGGGGSTVGGATEAKQDDIITAIEGISGTTNKTTRIATVGALTYIGNAALGSTESDNVWQIKRLDATSGLIKLWADGNDNFDNIWDNRASLSYS